MYKVFLVLLASGVIATGNLTAQNSRYETISGNEVKNEKSFYDKTMMRSINDFKEESIDLTELDREIIKRNSVNQQKDLVRIDEQISYPETMVEKPYKVYIEKKKSGKEDVATVILHVANNRGYQLLLDADAVLVDLFSEYYSSNHPALYNDCEYKIPENADSNLQNPFVISNGKGSVDIPEGVYDFVVLLPEGGQLYTTCWAETWDPANNIYTYTFINDYKFLAGYEYTLKVSGSNMVDFEVEFNASLTNLILPASSSNLTDSENITVTVANKGKHVFAGLSLSYSINNGIPVSESVQETLSPGQETTFTFITKADFSAGGLYKVEVWLNYALDMSPWKDRIKGFTKHIAPMPLPFKEDFESIENMVLWTMIDVDNDKWGWEYFSSLTDPDGTRGTIHVWSPWASGSPNAGNDYLITDPIAIPEAGTYNISFFSYCSSYLADEVESLSILYGKSQNYEDMEVLAEFSLAHLGWKINITNFEIQNAGAYHFAFYYHTVPESYFGSLYLDNIKIAAGEFVDGPDIRFESVITPFASCDINDGAIGAEVFNNGTVPLTEFTLTYQVDDETPVSETFYYTLGVRESAIAYFSQTCDLHAIGDYVVKFTAETPNEMEELTHNNFAQKTVSVVTPITELPFVRDFAFSADRADWHPAVNGGWAVANSLGYSYYWAVSDYVPLISRCVTLEPDSYRFKYEYSAGYDYYGDILYDDFYVTFGKQGTNPVLWQPVKDYTHCFSNGRVLDDFSVNITESGEYVFAFFPVKIEGTLRIFKATLEESPENDFRLNELVFPLSVARVTPEYHTDGKKTFTAKVENRGKANVQYGNIEIICDNKIIAEEEFHFSNLGEIINVDLDATFAFMYPGLHKITVNASIETGVNITKDYIRFVSDSTFVWDTIDDNFIDGVGKNGSPCAFGLIYELQKEDILTSLSVGLCEWPEDPNLTPDIPFGLAIYEVNQNMRLGNIIYESVQPRTMGSYEKALVFGMPDILMSPGRYYFEVRQISEYNIYVAYDKADGAFFYDNTGGNLTKVTNFGSVHLRPNFSKKGGNDNINKEEVAKFSIYPNPVKGMLNVNMGGATIEKIVVYNASGQIMTSVSNIKDTNYRFDTRFLSSGLYFISVQTKAEVVNAKFVVKD